MKSRSEIYVKAPRNKSVLIGWSAYGLLINVQTLWCVRLIFWKDHGVKFTHTEQILLLLQDCLSHSWWRSKMDGSIWSCKATGTREKWLVVCLYSFTFFVHDVARLFVSFLFDEYCSFDLSKHHKLWLN